MPEKIASLYAEIGLEKKGFDKGLGETKKGLEGAKKSFQGLTNEIPMLQRGLNLLANPLTLLAGGLTATVGFLVSATKETVLYAESVRDMARALGTSTEEASTLIQIADDLKIETGQLQMAFRNALQQGVSPTVDGLKGLAEEYQKIQDPVAKAQFAMEKFGQRAGLEMQKVLELTTEQIDAMAQSAEDAGLIMSEDAVKAAREYEIAMNNLGDSVTGVKIRIGNELIPVVTDFVELLNEDGMSSTGLIIRRLEKMGIEVDRVNGLMSGTGAIRLLERFGVVTDDSARMVERFNTMNERAALELKAMEEAQRNTNATIGGVPAVVDPAQTSVYEYSMAQYEAAQKTGYLYDETVLVKDVMSKFTEELVFQKAAANLSEEAALQLALGMGLVDEKTKYLLEHLPGLKQQFDANRDGIIDANEAASGFTLEVLRMTDALNGINGRTFNARLNLDIIETTTTNRRHGGEVTEEMRAAGGPVFAARPYIVGEQGPEMFVPRVNGQVLNHADTQRALGAPANVTININGSVTRDNAYHLARQIGSELARQGRYS
jgi:hypothetical protein